MAPGSLEVAFREATVKRCSWAAERGFFVRGYGGADKGAHCAHLGLLPEVVDLWRGTK